MQQAAELLPSATRSRRARKQAATRARRDAHRASGRSEEAFGTASAVGSTQLSDPAPLPAHLPVLQVQSTADAVATTPASVAKSRPALHGALPDACGAMPLDQVLWGVGLEAGGVCSRAGGRSSRERVCGPSPKAPFDGRAMRQLSHHPQLMWAQQPA